SVFHGLIGERCTNCAELAIQASAEHRSKGRAKALDNQKVKLTEELDTESTVRMFPSIAKLLGESPVTYE
ncbi:hypothetical protein R0G64_32330, partial [Pseudomonas otitidis]